MAKNKKTKFITKDILKSSIIGSFQKLDPRYMIKNPVMFVVEIGCFITLLLTFVPTLFGGSEQYRIYNGIVTVILFVTVLFANFAESVAEGRGKAQAASLKKTKQDTKARKLLSDGTEQIINASELKKGDLVLVKAGELIPNDGEVIEGIASVDESAITGESAPVTREAGGDFSSVTGGTTVVSDWLKIKIVAEPGKSFLDKMISMVEGASRQKTPNEIALNTLLIVLTLIFLIVVVRANLLRAISHDLRTPLTSISGSAGNLMANYNKMDDEMRKQTFADIYDDSMWLINLVENLLAVTRIEGERVNLNQTIELMDEVIAEALKHINRKGKEYTIKVDSSEELILAKIDVKLVVQVIINLVDNAIKYTPSGSIIHIHTQKQGKWVEVSISDNGPGIPDEQKTKIFDMFYSGANKIADSRRSLGLGLSLCKSIVTAHGGMISVSDNQPKGTIFTFTLPIGEVKIYE